MGMFYIYSLQNSDELYNSITFSNPHYVYIDPDNYYDLEKIEIKCKTQILNNFWDNFICAELLHTGKLIKNCRNGSKNVFFAVVQTIFCIYKFFLISMK